jgi:uncharacterized protein YbbC (DUF1343 family)
MMDAPLTLVSLLVSFLLHAGCQSPAPSYQENPETPPSEWTISPPLLTGAMQTTEYLPLLQGKRVGLVVNHTSLIGTTHLADSLLSLGVQVVAVFAPEHGFRGDADAGEHVKDGKDQKTGLPLISLYGSNRKPSPGQMAKVDVMVFDIQDVGVRFYTYISTMHYVMEAAAEANKKVLVLDRPNPNGMYVDGPILDPSQKSFVGMHPIPVLHGLTVGELANMINGEKWLEGGRTCALTVIPVKYYQHELPYSLPVRPSPNLPNDLSIFLYPSLCLFEGTDISVGRGTPTPFQIIGHPALKGKFPDTFTPQSLPGAKNPPHLGKPCHGTDFTKNPPKEGGFQLSYLLNYYQAFEPKDKFFNNFFEKLAGTPQLRKQIIAGMSEEEIRASWADDLAAYNKLRIKYLLYP